MPHIFLLTPLLALLLFLFLPRQVALTRESEASEIVRQRYARGEIDREEFQRMREELRS